MKSDRGFTLAEMLTVIAILGVLIAIAIPSYLYQADKARYAEAEVYAHDLATPRWEYRLIHGRFPPDVNNNVKPLGTDGRWHDKSAMPFKSSLDYDHHSVGGLCVVQITFFGKNGIRDTSPYDRTAIGDDRIIPISTYPCSIPAGAVR